MACNHPIKSGPGFLVSRQDHQTYVFGQTPFFLYSYISFRYVKSLSLLHIVVGMFLLPSTSPKLRTLTAYAASAMGAKLSFAFTLVTYKAVNPQFSTFLINTCRSCFAPIKSRLVPDFGRPPAINCIFIFGVYQYQAMVHNCVAPSLH